VPGAAPATPNTTQAIGPNARGPEVNTLQTNLNTWRAANGRTPPIAVDGQMGTETRAALRDYERESGIPEGRGQHAGGSALVQERLALDSNPSFQRLPADTRRAALDGMNAHPDNQAGRDNIRNLATDPGFGRANATHQGEALTALSRNPNDATHALNVSNTVGNADFQRASPATQTRTLNMLGANASNPAYGQDLNRLATNPRFTSMAAEDQTRTLNVFAGTTPAGRGHLQTLLGRDAANGSPALLSRGINPNSPTLLQELDRQASATPDARLPAGTDRRQISEEILQEVADPAHYVNQSGRGSCTVTSMGYDLARRSPAEYARLQTDLTTTGTTRLANGATMTVPPTAWAADGSGSRSTGERLMQSSMMNFARPGYTNNPPYTINNAGPPPTTTTNPDGWPDRPGSGLIASEENTMISALNNRPYTQGNYAALNTAVASGRTPVLTDVTWGTGGHAVEVTRIENGRVYYRNPWGGAGGVGNTGAVNAGPPPRTTTNGHQAEESMTVAQFQSIHRQSHIPAD